MFCYEDREHLASYLVVPNIFVLQKSIGIIRRMDEMRGTV